MQDRVVIGIDQSARGTAAVALREGRLDGQVFVADSKTAARRLAEYGARRPVAVRAGDELSRTLRLDALVNLLAAFVRDYRPTHLALEDYALSRQAFSHSLGEVGGAVRLVALWCRVPFRVYDIQAIKLFATGRGDADKADMIVACRSKWDEVDFHPFGREDGAGGNLADAYVIAQMLWTELRLRSAELKLEDLTDHERRVFLRTTRQQPENLLATPFAAHPTEREER